MRTNQNQQCQSSQKEIYIWKVITKLRKALSCFLCITVILTILSTVRVYAMTELETPDYKVAFFAFDCYHMQDKNGKRTGYGYEMMQGISEFFNKGE